MVKVKGLLRRGGGGGNLPLLTVWCSLLVCSILAARASDGELMVLVTFGFWTRKQSVLRLIANIGCVMIFFRLFTKQCEHFR